MYNFVYYMYIYINVHVYVFAYTHIQYMYIHINIYIHMLKFQIILKFQLASLQVNHSRAPFPAGKKETQRNWKNLKCLKPVLFEKLQLPWIHPEVHIIQTIYITKTKIRVKKVQNEKKMFQPWGYQQSPHRNQTNRNPHRFHHGLGTIDFQLHQRGADHPTNLADGSEEETPKRNMMVVC